MISLEAALECLLRSRPLRRALREGRCDALDVAPEDAAELLAIVPDELESTARAFVRSVRARSHRGCMNLERSFEATLASYRATHPEDATLDDLFARFVESSAFDASDVSASEEERFFRFLTDANIGAGTTRSADLLEATMRALLTAPDGALRPPPEVRRCPGGWFAVDETGVSPRLFAAARGRSLTGDVSRDIADILLGRAPGDAKTREALASMGLL